MKENCELLQRLTNNNQEPLGEADKQQFGTHFPFPTPSSPAQNPKTAALLQLPCVVDKFSIRFRGSG